MKTHVLFSFIILLIAWPYLGQSQGQGTREFLIGGDRPVDISGFASLMLELSSLEDEVVPSGGGGIAVLFDQTFFAGFYGLGTFKRMERPVAEFQEVDMAFGHGGLWLGYMYQSQRLLHLGLSLKVGGGGVYLAESKSTGYIFEEENKIDEDALFVLTPQAEIELNVAPWMKVNVGVGYRYVSDVDTPYLDASDFNSPVGNINLYFGWFQNRRGYDKE